MIIRRVPIEANTLVSLVCGIVLLDWLFTAVAVTLSANSETCEVTHLLAFFSSLWLCPSYIDLPIAHWSLQRDILFSPAWREKFAYVK